jgi:hypothetical protein
MPLYMDVHKLGSGVSLGEVAKAHQKDLEVQGEHGVRYLRYWVDQVDGVIYCLAEAPTPEAAMRVHREAHGLIADEIHEVVEGV